MEIASKFTILRGHPPRPLSNTRRGPRGIHRGGVYGGRGALRTFSENSRTSAPQRFSDARTTLPC